MYQTLTVTISQQTMLRLLTQGQLAISDLTIREHDTKQQLHQLLLECLRAELTAN